MTEPKDSSIQRRRSNANGLQPYNNQGALILRAISDLTNVVEDLSRDMEKLETYIGAIEKIIDGKHTPFDEVNQLREIVDVAKQQSNSINARYEKLVLFLSEAKDRYQLSENTVDGETNE